MLCAILIGQYIAMKRKEKYGATEDHVYDLIMYAVLFGLIGARLFHVAYEYQYYLQNISEIPQVWQGGLAIHGGIVFGALVIYIYSKIHKLSFLKLLDLFTPSILLGQIIGRFGNYFNQEAFGTPTSLPWGIYIRPEHRPIEFINFEAFHPTFFYEGLWNAVVLLLVLRIEKIYKPKPGTLAGIYLICYSIGRSIVEIIRIDATYLGPLKFIHWISLVLIPIGIFLICKTTVKK
jgi:phosphatidylglycerol:prolipoprotein diacylglycerol transferase